MKIELKNIKVDHELSSSTHYFNADLFIDGKAIVHILDRGVGGPFILTPLATDGIERYRAANQWCLKNQDELLRIYQLTPVTEHPADLEELICDFLQTDIEKTLLKEHYAEMEKSMRNAILYGVPGQLLYRRVLLDSPVDLLLATDTGTYHLGRTVLHRVLPKMTEAEKILNTNIAGEAWRKMGVPLDRIAEIPGDTIEKKPKKKTGTPGTSRSKSKTKKR